MPPRTYIVCSNIRAGSTLLCKTLEQLENYGQPSEFFHPHIVKKLQLEDHPDRFQNYCDTILQESLVNHGVFGIKLHWYQMCDVLKLARQSDCFNDKSDMDILNTLFLNPKFVYIWRRDVTAQAISAVIAFQTGQWEMIKTIQSENPSHTDQAIATSTPKKIKFQPIRIYEWEKFLQTQNQCWQDFFTHNLLPHHEVVYETLIDSFTSEINRVVSYLDVEKEKELHDIEMPTQQQSNQVNQRFMHDYQGLSKSQLEFFYQIYRIRNSIYRRLRGIGKRLINAV